MTELTTLHPFDQLLEFDRRCRNRKLPPADTESADGTADALALRLDPWNLLFPLDQVYELIPIPRITRVPGVKRWLLGIANLRGTIISVVDLRQFLGGNASTPTASSRMVIVRSGQSAYGLLIDSIIGMRHFGPQSRLPDLNGIDSQLRPFVKQGFLAEEQQWLLFNLEFLLKHPNFLGAADYIRST